MAGLSRVELRALVFNSDNYELWRARMRTILKSHRLWELVEVGLEVLDSRNGNEDITDEAKKIDPSIAEKAALNEILMKDARALRLIQLAASQIFPKILKPLRELGTFGNKSSE